MATVGTTTCPETGRLVLVIRFDTVAELNSFRNITRKNSKGDPPSYYDLLGEEFWIQDSDLSEDALYNVMQPCCDALSNQKL